MSTLNLLDLPELVTVAEDQVHVFVKGLEGANEDPSILQDAPHPVVDVLQHLTALTHRLKNNETSGQRTINTHHTLQTHTPVYKRTTVLNVLVCLSHNPSVVHLYTKS